MTFGPPVAARARALGLAVSGAGLLTLAATLGLPWRAGRWLAGLLFTAAGTQVAHGTAVFVGAALVVIGRGVAQRRRFAFHTTLGLLLLATVAHLVRGLDLPAAAITATLAGVVLWLRRLFTVPLRPARLRDLLPLALVLLAVDTGYGLIGLYSHHDAIHPRPSLITALGEVGARLIGLPGPLVVDGDFGRWFPPSLTAIGVLAMVVLLLAALGPVALRGAPPGADLAEAATLLGRRDGDSLDPFVLRRDKDLVFDPDRAAVLGYRYVRGVGLASGDPVGEPDAFPDAVRAFLRVCDQRGWRPAIMGVRADRAPMYAALGLRTLYIGDEAIIDVAGFSLAGRRMRNARQAVSRSRNNGLTTEILREGDLGPRLQRELRDVAARARRGHREFGFSMTMGDLFTGRHPDCLVIVCRDRHDRLVAFQRYLLCRHGKTLTLDTMRRLPNAPNGASERLIADVVDWARAHHVTEISLNFAAFRAVLDPGVDHRPGQAVAGWLLQRVEGRFGVQIDTLRTFNAKFAPRWTPRHLAYRTIGDLPAIGVAALAAEGFLPLDPHRGPDSRTDTAHPAGPRRT